VRSGEVDDDVDLAELPDGKGGAAGVLCGSRDSDRVLPFASHLGNQRSSLAAT
jgi:hypothetical protein